MAAATMGAKNGDRRKIFTSGRWLCWSNKTKWRFQLPELELSGDRRG
jgi:hypothetical protein